MKDDNAVNWAKTGLLFLQRVDVKGAEVDAFVNFRNGLAAVVDGKLALVPINIQPEESDGGKQDQGAA